MNTPTQSGRQEFKNPVNVGVGIVPVIDNDGSLIGALGCVRNLAPVGGVALIGGFQDEMHTLRETVRKELQEEAGIHNFALQDFQWVDERMTPNNRNLVFFEYTGPGLTVEQIKLLTHDATEVQELVVLTPDTQLCFNLHQEVLQEWFAQHGLYPTENIPSM